MIWFTADNHFGHEAIIDICGRPFKNEAEMEETMIEKWSERVKPGDVVYHLGDFALSYGAERKGRAGEILKRLPGQKWLISGNHDRKEVTRNPRWVKVKGIHEIKVPLQFIPADPEGRRKRIVLCHYALRTWNQMGRGSWMLHGHSHGNLTDYGGKICDVGVDCWDFAPVPITDIIKYMEKRRAVFCDHHTPDHRKPAVGVAFKGPTFSKHANQRNRQKRDSL
jgi:calcineurin-like phosphoesterase family protein